MSMLSKGVCLSGALSVVGASAAIGLAPAATNLIANPDMSLESGVMIPSGWEMPTYESDKPGSRIWAEPLSNGVFALNVRGGKSGFYWQQTGVTLVPGAKYRFSCEIRNAGGGQFRLYFRNKEWSWAPQSAIAPADTKGAWVNLACEFAAAATKFPDKYVLAITGRAGPSGTGRAEIRNLRLVALDPAAEAKSRPKQLSTVRLPARIVPVDPLLSRVDAKTGQMRFYWPRATATPGCRLVGSVKGGTAREAAFDAEGYAELVLGAVKAGEHRVVVRTLAQDGAPLASNDYRIVAGSWKNAAQIGRRLNNLVTELVNAPLADGEVPFERAEDGWTWISFDGDCGDARGYLDGCLECAVYRREGEPTVDVQRYLKAGRHTLRVTGAKGGRLRIHAVKTIMGGSFDGFEMSKCRFESFSGYRFSLPFMRRYGLLSGVNTISSDNAAKLLAEPSSVAVETGLARGMHLSRSCGYFGPDHPDRNSTETTYRRITQGIWRDFPGLTGIDENQLICDAFRAVNFSEAVWQIADDYPKNPLTLFYWDTSTGACYNEPRQHVSEIASIVNTGSGRGMLTPEFYMPVTRTRGDFQKYIDICAGFIESALRMVPASRGKAIPYCSSYIMLGEWCNYFAPEADIKVHTSELIRSYATDPRFAECAGMGFGGIGCGNEEYVRWSMKLVRYYALEGGTEDLAAKYGFKWNPGFVTDPDFRQGLTNWTAKAAEPGSLAAERIRQYGMLYQHRVGAPGGFGDTLAKFTVSKAAPNVLSQKLTGLKTGAYYSLQYNVTDRLPPDDKGDKWRLEKTTMTARLEGGEEIVPLRYSHPICPSGSVPETDRRRALLHNDRYVFRATAPEATLVFTDRPEGDVRANDVGRTYLLNYIIFTPFYCESEADLRELAATVSGGESTK